MACGFSPVEAIHAATGATASALALEHLGEIAPGKVADLVAVEGDLSADIRHLTNVRAVFQSGTLVHGRLDS